MYFTLEPRFHKMVGAGTYIQAALEETVMVSDDGVEILTTTPFLDECLRPLCNGRIRWRPTRASSSRPIG